MTEKRTIHNEDRPAQPEPGEDEAVQMPAVREQAGRDDDSERAQQRERERQTGE